MTPAAKIQFATKTRELEGVISWPYRDTVGVVTIGIGHAIESQSAWREIGLVNSLDGSTPSVDDLDAEWLELQRQPFGHEYSAHYYATHSTLILPEAAIDALFEADVDILEQEARGIFPGYDSSPTPAQLGVMSMIYSLGPGRIHGFPLCCAALRTGKFDIAAAQCHMNGCSDARNAFTRSCFLAAAP